MIAVVIWTLAAHAHGGVDSDDDGWQDSADCAPTDPSAFPGARERCDGIDNDCDDNVDEDGACVDDVLPCYQIETASKPALEGDPCLLATDPNRAVGCGSSTGDSGEAVLLFGLLALGRRRR